MNEYDNTEELEPTGETGNDELLGDGLEEEGTEDLYGFGEEYGEGDDDWHYEPPGPSLIETEEPVDPSAYAAIVHDSFGTRYINVETLEARAHGVTILRVLGVLELEPRGEVQFFLDGDLVSPSHVVPAGSTIYIVGKLAGGK